MEAFDPQKLRASLERARAKKESIDRIVKHIEQEIKEGMTTKEIYTHAFSLLKKEDRRASAHYSLRKAILALGPSGFPFEKFVAQIFIANGYEAQSGVMMLGECVEHEVDVVAWDEKKLVIVEAKFHNEPNGKSDLKVVLYIKARFDDLANTIFDFGKKRKIDESWLVTNTKFSSEAIKYAECKSMKLVGWNYPHEKNLEEMIIDARLHPITCLTTTTPQEEAALMQAGVVLCKQAKENPDILKQVGINDQKIKEIMEEIEIISN